jgi:hypothetical protein
VAAFITALRFPTFHHDGAQALGNTGLFCHPTSEDRTSRGRPR